MAAKKMATKIKKHHNVKQMAGKKKFTYAKLILLLAIIFALGAFFTFIYYINFEIIDYKEINTSIKVTARGTGLNVDKDSLNFGKIYPGGGVIRSFELKSDVEALVRISVKGPMNGWLNFSENNFILPAREGRNITVELTVPEGTPLGNYSSKVKVYLLKP
jgi:hypothetical protein